MSQTPTPGGVAEAPCMAETADTVVVGAVARVTAGHPESGALASGLSDPVARLKSGGRRMVVLRMGSPHALKDLRDADGVVCTYGDGATSIAAGLGALFGEFSPKGTLPATVPSKYPRDHGLGYS